MNPELKPCRCGGKAVVFVNSYQHGYVCCRTCGIETETSGEYIADWNRIMDTSEEDRLRAELLQKTQQLEALKEAAKQLIQSCIFYQHHGYGFDAIKEDSQKLKGML